MTSTDSQVITMDGTQQNITAATIENAILACQPDQRAEIIVKNAKLIQAVTIATKNDVLTLRFCDCEFLGGVDGQGSLRLDDCRVYSLSIERSNFAHGLSLCSSKISGESEFSEIRSKGCLRLDGTLFGERLAFSDIEIRETGSGPSITANKSVFSLSLEFYACDLDSSISLVDVTCKENVEIKTCKIGRESQSLDLSRSSIKGSLLIDTCMLHGTIGLSLAEIHGEIEINNSSIHDPGVCVVASHLSVAKSITINLSQLGLGSKAPVNDPAFVYSSGAILISESDKETYNVAMSLGALNVGGDFIITASEISGSLYMEAAQISGDFRVSRNARLESGSIEIAKSSIGGIVDLSTANINGAVDATWISCYAIDCTRLNIAGSFKLIGARISAYANWQNASIEGDVLMRYCKAVAASFVQMNLIGRLDLEGADISTFVDISKVRIKGEVWAHGLTSALVRMNFIRIAVRKDNASITLTESRLGRIQGINIKLSGRIDIEHSIIGGDVNLSRAKIYGTTGSSIDAFSCRFEKSILLKEGQFNGAIDFRRTHVAERIDLEDSLCRSARCARRSGIKLAEPVKTALYMELDASAIVLLDARAHEIRLPNTSKYRVQGVIDLRRAKVSVLTDHAIAWPKRSTDKDIEGLSITEGLRLEGCEYGILSYPDGTRMAGVQERGVPRIWEKRVEWLELQAAEELNKNFLAQPWEQLARTLNAAGYVEDAQRILIERYRRERRRRNTPRIVAAGQYLLEKYVAYGFSPWRSIPWMMAFIALFGAIWTGAASFCNQSDCKDNSIFLMSKAGDFGSTPYPEFNGWLYSVDSFLPLVELGYQEKWEPNKAATMKIAPLGVDIRFGEMLYWIYFAEVLFGFIMASISVSAFAGLLYSSSRR